MSSTRAPNELTTLYLLRCQVEGKSRQTVRAYRETLGRFLRVVPASQIDAITTDDIYSYLARFSHLSLETRHRYFREVRCFFNWLVETGRLEDNPFRGIKNVKLPQRIVEPFSSEDVERLLAAIDRTTAIGARDRAIVLCLVDTGLRCSELVHLSLNDLDIEERRMQVRHGKGNKQRVVPFASACSEALERYLEHRGATAGPLFAAASHLGVLKPGVRLQPNGLKQMLRRLGRRAGVPKVHAHRFRHTFATWAIAHDARELDVQYLLGHSSPDMVRRYSSAYRSEQAALRHHRFSPGDQMIGSRP